MKRPITFRLTCLLLLISLTSLSLQAQEKEKKEKAPLLSGVAVSADLLGFAQKVIGSKYTNMEVGARINFIDKYSKSI